MLELYNDPQMGQLTHHPLRRGEAGTVKLLMNSPGDRDTISFEEQPSPGFSKSEILNLLIDQIKQDPVANQSRPELDMTRTKIVLKGLSPREPHIGSAVQAAILNLEEPYRFDMELGKMRETASSPNRPH